jgi:hypothetical protein
MMWVGLVLLLLGFVMVAPRGATPGSVSRRIVQMPAGSFFKTPGYQEEPPARLRLIRMLIGLAMLAAGGIILWVSV